MLAAMFVAPAAPPFLPGYTATSSAYLRYEDVTMDGRLIPLGAPSGLAGLWREVLVAHPGAINALHLGIIPILTRLTIHTMDRSIRVDRPVETRNGFALAHDRDGGGEVSRLFMNVWCEIHGLAGRLGRTAPSGELALAGRVFAEHTFTRLLAAPDQRRVTKLGVDGYPDVPELHYAQPAPATAAEAPDGTKFVEELAPDSTDYAFTLDQTDSNQHVNSLVYVRLFLEAVNRRLAATGRSLKVRATAVDIAYRKPCFAGDRVRAQLRLFEGDSGALGAAGQVVGDDGKPRCYVRVALGT
jgi:acyl-CoA thioesterase FadM